LLFPLAALVTPNIPEAASLAGMAIATSQDIAEAGRRIRGFGARAVLIKGGHLTGDDATDVLLDDSGEFNQFSGKRVDTKHTHGTGCTYSAAITAGLASGNNLLDAVRRAKKFLQTAIESAPGLGQGLGPVNHFAMPE
jgi:hydroxymethylpyrimidine/phosphomethylpyrimidine kinase